MREGLYYNPYFPGGAIAMPRMLADGGVEYDDGTPSNSSQQAKVRRGVGVVWRGVLHAVATRAASFDTQR